MNLEIGKLHAAVNDTDRDSGYPSHLHKGTMTGEVSGRNEEKSKPKERDKLRMAGRIGG